jgi:cell division protein FtsL
MLKPSVSHGRKVSASVEAEQSEQGIPPMRLLNVTAFFFAITSALLLYGLNYDTRRLEDEVQAKEHAAELARNDIAVLKAERGNLARPDRIDALAHQLGLSPPKPEQFETGREVSELNDRQDNTDGNR